MLHYLIRQKDTKALEALVSEMYSKRVPVKIAEYNRILQYFAVFFLLFLHFYSIFAHFCPL